MAKTLTAAREKYFKVFFRFIFRIPPKKSFFIISNKEKLDHYIFFMEVIAFLYQL
jgi:hypothetical protein